MPEERAVVGDGADLARIGVRDRGRLRIRRVDQLRNDARTLRQARRPRRRAQRHRLDGLLVPLHLGGSERCALEHDRRQVAGLVGDVRRDDHVRARVLDPHFGERLARGHHVTARPVRRVAVVQLAELHDHHAAVGEVLETLLDHLRRVEVALRQHERARGRRVVRGIAVGRHEPHEVVLVVRAGQVRTTVALVDVHARLVRQVARVLLVAIAHEIHGDRVQLDAVDLLRLVVQRRDDLVPAGRADDERVVGRARRARRTGGNGDRRSNLVTPAALPSNLSMIEPNVPSWNSDLKSGRMSATSTRNTGPQSEDSACAGLALVSSGRTSGTPTPVAAIRSEQSEGADDHARDHRTPQ